MNVLSTTFRKCSLGSDSGSNRDLNYYSSPRIRRCRSVGRTEDQTVQPGMKGLDALDERVFVGGGRACWVWLILLKR